MTLPVTETLPEGVPLDARPAPEAILYMLEAQQAALASIRAASTDIVKGAEAMASAIRAGRRVHYVAAGSSGLMALADASELPGTFGIPLTLVKIHMAGGVPADGHMPGNTEDDVVAAEGVEREISTGDVVIVLTASGSTPYALEIARRASAKGAIVAGVANNHGARLFDLVDIPICLATPAEVVAGSTRLGAGTAQKAALNIMSTLMGVALGHVYQGQMVNVVADNAKLVSRSAGIVARIASVSEAEATDAIARAQGSVKHAILIALGGSPAQASDLLAAHDGQLAPCIEALKSNQNQSV